MKRFAAAFAFLALAVISPAQSLRAQINAADRLASQALAKKDMSAFSRWIKPTVTPDFKYTEAGTSMNFDQMVAAIKQGMAAFKKVTFAKATIQTLDQKGDSARATILHQMAGTTVGADRKIHKMAFTGSSIDTYVRVGSKWKLKSMDWKNNVMTLDGKQMNPGR